MIAKHKRAGVRPSGWARIALGALGLIPCGCGGSPPPPPAPAPIDAPATPAPTPAPAPAPVPASDPAPPGPTSGAVVTLTPRCAAEVRRAMEGDARLKLLFLHVNVAPSCTGFSYAAELRGSPPAGDVILASSEGIRLAIDGEDAAFLQGATLDYLPDPGGFKFINPREDKSLLREYREMAEEAARLRPILEAQANKVDPAKAVADLRTGRRQEAFEELHLWWKFHQPGEVDMDDEAGEVGRVDRYQPAGGPPITVVFKGAPGEQDGGVTLIRDDGRRIPFSNNYIGEDDRVADVDGDGIPELISSNDIGGKDEDNPNKFVRDAAHVEIAPIAEDPSPRLSVVFDARPFRAASTWRWSLADNPSGSRDVVLEQQTAGAWAERARFAWSKASNRFEGPAGSKGEGFLFRPGRIPADQIEAFLKRPRGQ